MFFNLLVVIAVHGFVKILFPLSRITHHSHAYLPITCTEYYSSLLSPHFFWKPLQFCLLLLLLLLFFYLNRDPSWRVMLRKRHLVKPAHSTVFLTLRHAYFAYFFWSLFLPSFVMS